MEDYPKTIAEFESRFSSEEACRNYLYQLRWPLGFICPRCRATKAWPTKRNLLVCGGCGYQVSMYGWNHLFKIPASRWVCGFERFVTDQKTGTSALGLQRLLGLGSYLTAWTWLHKLRRPWSDPEGVAFRDEIEVDETYVGGEKPGKRGRGALGKSLVVIAAEKDGKRIGRIRLVRVPDASAESLEEAIRQSIIPGSAISTDGWKGYARLVSLGYTHDVVRKTAEVGDDLLPHCHRVASLLKRWILGTHQGAVSHDHLDYYLDEYIFRFNRRTSRSRGKLFYRLVQQAVAIEPAPYKAMIETVKR